MSDQKSDSKNRRWKVLDEKEICRTKYFQVRSERCQVNDGRVIDDYYLVDCQNWVNVVPITEEGKVVMIEQYRHGAREWMLEIPGGMLDSPGEDPKRAALRELEEETGYVPGEIQHVGSHFPNPAMQTNSQHTFVAFSCKKQSAQNLDQFEEIRVVLKTVPELLLAIKEGQIKHTIVLASLLMALPSLGCNIS